MLYLTKVEGKESDIGTTKKKKKKSTHTYLHLRLFCLSRLKKTSPGWGLSHLLSWIHNMKWWHINAQLRAIMLKIVKNSHVSIPVFHFLHVNNSPSLQFKWVILWGIIKIILINVSSKNNKTPWLMKLYYNLKNIYIYFTKLTTYLNFSLWWKFFSNQQGGHTK